MYLHSQVLCKNDVQFLVYSFTGPSNVTEKHPLVEEAIQKKLAEGKKSIKSLFIEFKCRRISKLNSYNMRFMLQRPVGQIQILQSCTWK